MKPMNKDAERSGPGFDRLKNRMGPEAYERMRQDTLRQQEEALRNIREPVAPRRKAGPKILTDIITGRK